MSGRCVLEASALQTIRIRAPCANFRSMAPPGRVLSHGPCSQPRPVFPATGRGPMLHLVAAEGRAKIVVFLRLEGSDEER